MLYDPAARRFNLVPDPTGLFLMPITSAFFIHDEALGYADLDGDGKAELFAHTVAGPRSGNEPDLPERLTVWKPTLDPTATTAGQLVTRTILDNPGLTRGLGAILSTVVADFNRDGNPDLAFGDGHNTTTVAFGNGDLTFRDPVVYLTNSEHIAAADVDGDGVLDLVTHYVSPGTDASDQPRFGVLPGPAGRHLRPLPGSRHVRRRCRQYPRARRLQPRRQDRHRCRRWQHPVQRLHPSGPPARPWGRQHRRP